MTDYWFIQLGPNYGGQAAVRISWDNEQLLPHELSVEYKTATDNTGIKPAVEHGGSYEGKKTSIFFHQLWFKKSSISHKSFYFVWWQWCIWHTLVCDSIKLLYHSDHNLSVVNIYFFFFSLDNIVPFQCHKCFAELIILLLTVKHTALDIHKVKTVPSCCIADKRAVLRTTLLSEIYGQFC